MNYLNLVVIAIVAIAAINWGIVGYNPSYDLVKLMTAGHPNIEKYIKIAIGVIGLYYIYLIYMWKTNTHEEEKVKN